MLTTIVLPATTSTRLVCNTLWFKLECTSVNFTHYPMSTTMVLTGNSIHTSSLHTLVKIGMHWCKLHALSFCEGSSLIYIIYHLSKMEGTDMCSIPKDLSMSPALSHMSRSSGGILRTLSISTNEPVISCRLGLYDPCVALFFLTEHTKNESNMMTMISTTAPASDAPMMIQLMLG